MNEHSLPKILIASALGLILVMLLTMGLSGCATQQSSNEAEGAWLVEEVAATAQDVQIAKHPCCYSEPLGASHPSDGVVVLEHGALMIAHTLLTSWMDDEVARHPDSDAWLITRFSWGALSLLGTGWEIGRNYNDHVTPFKVEQ